MSALQVETFCGCINLRTGALIMGYIALINNILEIRSMGVAIAGGMTIERGDVVQMLLCVISILFCKYLLAGVYERRPSYVRAAWLYMIVAMLLDAVQLVCNTAYLNGLVYVIIILIGSCLYIYFAVCVRSYELALKKEDLNRPNQDGHV